jgi:hypothetical protein
VSTIGTRAARRVTRGLLALVALAAAVPVAAAAPGSGGLALGTTLPGHTSLLVEFRDHPSPAVVRARLRGLGRISAVVPEIGIWSLRPRHPVPARALALARVEVQDAEWSLERTTNGQQPRGGVPPAAAVNPEFRDPLFSPADQWGLFTNYWSPDLTGSLPRPRIAILDGGIDPTHEEWSGPNSPLVDPRSTYQGTDDATDWGRTGHGTHVAGIAAAPANNGVGIVGVAPAERGVAEIIPVQIADRDGRSTDETMMKGIRWAVNHGARVINISAGGPGYSQAFQDTVDWAFARGALVIASVGNEGEDENDLNYPAGYDHVLGVGALCDDERDPPDCITPFGVAGFSNHNGTVDVVAPGVNVLSSVPKRVHDREFAPGYALKDGTSMAAPYVTGTAALVFAAYPTASPYQVMRQLENTAYTPPGSPAGRSNGAGYGAINPKAAVTLPLPADDPTEVNDDISKVTSVPSLKESAEPRVIDARADQWDDPHDVYPVQLRRGERVRITLRHVKGSFNLALWRPGTPTVTPKRGASAPMAVSLAPGSLQVVTARAPRTGRYYVDVAAKRGGGLYTLTIARNGSG